ncbi:MAG: lamin tail domain-containing protein [Verrucomicrobiales bacterium]
MSNIAKLRRTLLSITSVALGGLAALAPSASAQSELLITEIYYHPYEVTDPNENLEFIEVKNVGDEAQLMNGYTFDGVGTVAIPLGTTIQPGGILVIAKNTGVNSGVFQATYGFTPVATFDGSLRNSGEKLDILPPGLDAEPVFEVEYWDGDDPEPGMEEEQANRPLWPSSPDGDGYSLVPQNPNVNTDPDDFRNWRPSIRIGGSPGSDEPLPDPLTPVFINEIRTRDGDLSNDAIEFYNPNGSAVDISDWFLSDNIDNPKKSPVPDGTVIPAGGYTVLENGVDGFVISLSSQGERVFLYSADAGGNLTGFVNGLHFLASGDGQTFSRYINSEGTEQFPASAPTLGLVNAPPSVGPVVITEIMYNPGALGDDDEFIEVRNISGAAVPLYDPLKPLNNWRVEGVNYILPGAQPLLAAGEIALIVPTAPETFRAKHGVPLGIQIFGPFDGSLNNGGEEVALQRPENLDDEDLNKTSYINVDVVLYDNSDPWPADAAGLGRSLVRVDSSAYGDDPINWEASLELGGSPGVIYNYTGPEILVNEVLAHTDIEPVPDGGQVDVIELHNPTGASVDIGRWWLSDSKDDPKRFQIPSGTMIPATGFWAVNEDNDANVQNGAPAGYFGNAFRISSRGDQIYLFSADATGELTGYRHGFSFRATANGRPANGNQTLGRYVDTFGREHFTKQVRSFDVNRFTPNPPARVNNLPLVGPVVISEINFDPAPGGVEFIEMANISGSPVQLYDTSAGGNPSNTWALEGVTFSFPTPTPTLPADGVVVILPRGVSEAAFRAANNVPEEAFVIGGTRGYLGALNNGGEELARLRPDTPDNVGGEIIVPMIAVDVVNYRDSDFWPDGGAGISLEKFDLSGFSDDPIYWRSSAEVGGNPGTVPEGLFYDLWSVKNFSSEALAAGTDIGCEDDVNGDGISNLFAYAFGYDPHTTPAGNLFPQGSITDVGGMDYLTLSFRMQTESTDLVYDVQSSIDLTSWTPMSGVQVGMGVDNGDGTETVQFRSEQSTGDADSLFMRLNISKQ